VNERTDERNTTDEVIIYWRQIVGTLGQRGLVKQRPQQGGAILPVADAFLLPDRCIFALDMQRLGGIPREEWLKQELWRQWRAALQGRRVFVSDGGGLAITVAREPGQRQPATIPLNLDEVSDAPYEVILGHTRCGRVTLDLAEGNRAILTGGWSGGGKTNLIQSIVLQLAAKHGSHEFQVSIVDPKQVDFGPLTPYAHLPHLAGPVAYTIEEASRSIEGVYTEFLRRQALMAAAGVADWRDLIGTDRLPLLLLAIDEAADLAGTPAAGTVVRLAREARAMGISLIFGTQHPTTQVIDSQVKANLTTAVAFQTRTAVESQAILGCKGAEELNRPGLALTFLDGRWQTVQTLRVEPEAAEALAGQVAAPQLPALDDVEADLVRYAVEHLDDAFIINHLYEVFGARISKRQLTKLGQQWEARGWLTPPASRSDPRRVTGELVGLALGRENGDTVTRMTRGDTAPEVVTQGTSQDDTELPPFLAQQRARVKR
jgi:DNA segregation ATPase FtsK/SpoIIIE-like protein